MEKTQPNPDEKMSRDIKQFNKLAYEQAMGFRSPIENVSQQL